MSTTRDMAGALNHASGLVPIAEDSAIAMDPLTAKGGEIMNNMEREYGAKKGKSVFYASKNAGKISGVDEAEEDDAEDCNAMDGGPDSGPRQRIALELREIAERSEAARSEEEIKALQERRNQLLIELRKPNVSNDDPGKAKDGGPGSGPQKGGEPGQSGFKGNTVRGNEPGQSGYKSGGGRGSEPGQSGYKGEGSQPGQRTEHDNPAHDAMTDAEIEKWEKEKANAGSMEPKGVENTQPATGRFGARPSPYVSPSRPFTKKDERNTAGTGS